MKARAIGSIVWTATSGGTKLIAKLFMAARRARGEVKKSARTFYKTMLEYGIPEDAAKNITIAYAEPGLEILKIRNLIKMANEMSDA
ncbi:MAG: hypothetical protein P1Q69_21375 [Candidatus Thorarchaeota archaeon]|nr:hypothetical protein [Candidatus Thorarchaeota archaeon]